MKTINLTTLIVFTASAIALSACKDAEKSDARPALDFDDLAVKEAYAVGIAAGKSMANNISSLDGTNITLDTEVLLLAYADGLKGEAQMDEKMQQETINAFRGRVNKAMEEKRKLETDERAKEAAANKVTGEAFLAENKTKEGVVTLESGLQYKVISEGSGKSPAATDKVKVHYKGTLMDGTQFDSSYDRGQPATFGVNRVIKGWTEGLQLMKEGAKWQLYIPAELAYGETGRPNIPGNSPLVFDVELLEVIPVEAAKPTSETKKDAEVGTAATK